LLLTVGSKKRRGVLWLARSRREDSEVGVAKGRRQQTRRLLLLRLGRKASSQIECGDSGWIGEARLGEGLGRRLLVTQEAARVGIISREVGLVSGKLVGGRLDRTETKTKR
jgi:hypothetical protein